MMDGWKELVKTVLLGTTTQRQQGKQAQQTLENYGFDFSESDKETTVLQALAAFSQLNKAGLAPKSLSHAPKLPVCPEETLDPCSEQATSYLKHILQNNYEEILEELLGILQAQAQRIPHILLPQLMTYGAIHIELRPALLPCLGERGKWLAQFNERWSYVLNTPENDRIFEFGKRKERLEYLENLRRKNPAAALAQLKTVWKEESYTTRAAFLKTLQINLSENDEAFLETCLKDRRKEVRLVAIELLRQLPNTKLSKRVVAILEDFVQYSPTNDELKVILPEKCTDAMKKNGVQARYHPLPDEGKRANCLAQLLALVPPSHWCQTWQKTPQELLRLVAQSDWDKLFIWAWAKAAVFQQDEDWLLACHEFYVDTQYNKRWIKLSLDFMYEGLPDKAFNQISLNYLNAGSQVSLSDDHPVVNFLLQENQSWSDELAKKAIHRIKQTIAQDSYVFHWSLKSVLKRAAYAVNPQLYEQVKENWPTSSKSWHSWQIEVDNFLSILRLRKDIQALKN